MPITFLRFTALFAKICSAKIKCYYEKRYECYEKLKENTQKLDTICKNLCYITVFGLMNHKNKFCKNFFLSLIGSTAFKLGDLLITFLFFRLFDNALMKAYSLYGRGGGKKSFNESKWVSEFCLFEVSFCCAKKWIEYFPFPFLHCES